MKKLLSLLGAISLVGTSTTSLVACNNTPQEYTKEKLEHLKKENQINTDNQEIKNNLEWMAAQEKPFNEVDNKYYFVVWRSDDKNDWRIIKFNNNKVNIIIDNFKHYELEKYNLPLLGNDLYIKNESGIRYATWKDDTKNTYFKSVYRWNGEEQKLPNLDTDENCNIKVNT